MAPPLPFDSQFANFVSFTTNGFFVKLAEMIDVICNYVSILERGEGLLYCDYKVSRPAREGQSAPEKPDFNLSEFREKDPFEIAERYFTETLQTDMDDTLKELLHSVIQEVREEEAR